MGRVPHETAFTKAMAMDVETVRRELVTFIAAGLSAQ
jgi:hypothetical protein